MTDAFPDFPTPQQAANLCGTPYPAKLFDPAAPHRARKQRASVTFVTFDAPPPEKS